MKKLSLTALFAAGLATAAMAANHPALHIVGSTAYRAAVSQAIYDYLSANGPVTIVLKGSNVAAAALPPVANNQQYKDLLGASAASFSGQLPNGDPIEVEAFWTGSLAGTVDVSLGNTFTGFINLDATLGVNNADGEINEVAAVTNEAATAADVAMSDSSLTAILGELSDVVSAYPAPNNTSAGIINTITNASLLDGGVTASTNNCVGIVPFEVLCGNPTGGGETASNITSQAFKAALTKGYVQFSELSGLTTDGTNFAVVVGRSEDSGTRIDSLSESQAEEIANYDFPPIQVNVTFNNNAKTDTNFANTDPGFNVGGVGSQVATIKKWPANYALNPTQPNLSWAAAGHSGQFSGGDVANVLSAANNGFYTTAANINNQLLSHAKTTYFTAGTSKVSLIGYAGITDSATAVGNGAVAMSYNGVTYSQAAVEGGQYSLWGYEHLYYTTAFHTAGGDPLTLADGIADTVFGTDADIDSNGDLGHAGNTSAPGVKYGNMKVGRTTAEGEYIFPNK